MLLKHLNVYAITFFTLQDTTVSRSRVKNKQKNIQYICENYNPPSYITGLIWKLLLLTRRHKNLDVMNTLPPTYSGMTDKQALFLSKQTQKNIEKRAPLLHTVRIICFLLTQVVCAANFQVPFFLHNCRQVSYATQLFRKITQISKFAKSTLLITEIGRAHV